MHLIIFCCNLLLNPSIRDVSQCDLLFAAIYVYFLQFFDIFCVFLQYVFAASRFLAGGYAGLQILMQGLKISSFDRINTETIFLSLVSVEPLMPDRSCWCVQCLGGRTVFLWEHSVLLVRALGRWGALVTGCPRKGQFQEDADSSLIYLWNGSSLQILFSVPWEEFLGPWW